MNAIDCRRPAGRALFLWMRRALVLGCLSALVIVPLPGCGDGLGPALERLTQAQRLASSLQLQFSEAVTASNRATMADTDELSTAFAQEARQSLEVVARDADALRPLLASLDYSEESRLLEEFGVRFDEYQALDRELLVLAVENSNLKAQRLSFGAIRQAADAVRDALQSVVTAAPPDVAWQVRALAITAVSSVREVEVLDAPHIAEGDDAAMTALEAQMSAAEAQAREALESLATLVAPASQAALADAQAALDEFTRLHAELLTLSRRNSNVQSLELSLGRSRTLAAGCADSLRALQEILGKRRLGGTR